MIRLIGVFFLLTGSGAYGQSNYYDQFQFEVTGSCLDPSTLWFRAVTTRHVEPFVSRGETIQPSLKLQIFKNGTYWGLYSEDRYERSATGQIRSDNVYHTTLHGRWFLHGNQIHLTRLGFGVPSVYQFGDQDLPAFALKVTHQINDPRLIGSVLNMGRVVTDMGPMGLSRRHYCGGW